MALTVGDRDVRPLTADEVMRMVDVGLLAEDEPVELLHGVLTKVSPKSPRHVVVKRRLVRWLVANVDLGRYDVRTEDPLAVPDRTSLPEPDLAVVERHDDPERHPTTALLVIEVAVSSLRVDTTIKPPLYAAAGVPELWIVDVDGRRVTRFTEPGAEGYATRETIMRGALEALHVGAGALALEDLLAGVAAGED